MASMVWLARPKGRRTATVIFLHGLGGHAYGTWRRSRSDMPWPVWLAEDLDDVAVATVSYAAGPSGWTGSSLSLDERAKSLFPLVAKAATDLGEPVVFVCHSLGGLIVKRIITMAASGQHFQEEGETFVDHVKGVVFYATPHGGSGYGDLADHLRFIVWPTPTMSYLTRKSTEVATLNEAYRNWAATANVRHLIIYETRPTVFGWIVRAREADPGIARASLQPGEADHFKVCKPFDKGDARYTLTRDFILSVVQQFPTSSEPASGAPDELTIPVPLPPLPPGEPIIKSHLAVRALLTLLLMYTGYRGVVSIYADPFHIRSILQEHGVDNQDQAVLSRRILADADKRQINGETVANILKRNGLPLDADPNTLYQNVVALLTKYSDVRERTTALAKSADEEVRSFSASADTALQSGNIRQADMLTQAAELRAKLASQVKFTQIDSSHVVITNGWDRTNIARVHIPRISDLTGAPDIQFYKGGIDQLKAAFAEVHADGLDDQITQFCGSYVPRVERFSRLLSTHALGIALDIDCQNLGPGMKVDPAPLSRFRRLVDIFQKHGFLWGGQFSTPDPMHFQLYRIEGGAEAPGVATDDVN